MERLGKYLSNIVILDNVCDNLIPQHPRTCDIAQKLFDTLGHASRYASHPSVSVSGRFTETDEPLHLFMKRSRVLQNLERQCLELVLSADMAFARRTTRSRTDVIKHPGAMIAGMVEGLR